MITSCALFFIAHIAIHTGATGSFVTRVDWLALLRYKVGVIPIISACGLAGLVLRMLY